MKSLLSFAVGEVAENPSVPYSVNPDHVIAVFGGSTPSTCVIVVQGDLLSRNTLTTKLTVKRSEASVKDEWNRCSNLGS